MKLMHGLFAAALVAFLITNTTAIRLVKAQGDETQSDSQSPSEDNNQQPTDSGSTDEEQGETEEDSPPPPEDVTDAQSDSADLPEEQPETQIESTDSLAEETEPEDGSPDSTEPQTETEADSAAPSDEQDQVDDTNAEPPSLDEMVENEQPAFFVHAEVDNPMREYRQGDPLAIEVRTESDAYLYVLYQQADGKVYQIFPNSAQQDNRVPAGQTVSVPGENDLFRWIVGAPFGKEVVKVIASHEPLDDLSAPVLQAARFNPVDAKTLRAAAKSLKAADPSRWAEVDIEIQTFPRDERPGGPGSRRWGVFFGVSKYRYHDVVQEITDGERGLNLRGCHLDAEKMGATLSDLGLFSGGRVFVNEEATRENLEWAVTKWLRDVSRPGDTVVIYFSGHGGQLPDDNGDERDDGLDEVICPHDFMSVSIFEALTEKYQQGQLSADERKRVERLASAVRGASDREQADAILTRMTCVSDDLFARWLQKLSGRQVTVILDTCYSGGFATQEKSFDLVRGAAAFDFLESESARLKDIGQQEQAIMAASKAPQVSYELPNGENGVMTYFFMESIRQLGGPLHLEEAYEFCRLAMEEYFVALNERLEQEGHDPLTPHQPHMKNHCSRPVLLKP